MQAVGQRVEIGEAGRDTDHLAAAVGDCLDLGEGAIHEVAQREVVLRRAALGDLVDLGLRAIHDVVDVAFSGVPHLHDAGTRLDQAAQDRTLLDDGRVVAGIGRRGHERHECVEVRRTADAADLTHPGELGGDRHGVCWIALAVDGDDRVVDRRVCGAVEVSFAQHFHDVGDGVLAEHHRAEHGLLSGNILRGCAVRGRATAIVIGDREFGDAHAHSSPDPTRQRLASPLHHRGPTVVHP